MLTERKKADRETMAQMVEALCAKHGATCSRDKIHDPRRIRLLIACEGVTVHPDFDGDNCVELLDNYCLTWCVEHASDKRLSRQFGVSQGAEVNPFHRRKCTAFARGIDQLLQQLGDAFELLKNGSAFEKMAFDLSKPGVAVQASTFGGGWAWPLNEKGREALRAYFGENPVPLRPLDGRKGYIVEPYDAHDLAEHLRACEVAWKVA